MHDAMLLLAGGAARRLPGKLEQPIGGRPLILRTFARLRETGLPIYVAVGEAFPEAIAARLDAPLIVDRKPYGGPLAALLAAASQIEADRIFAVAADLPQIEASVLLRLSDAWRAGDEAVVPQHGERVEPLAALYDRDALLRESAGLLREQGRAMRDLTSRLATRLVPMDARFFFNVNTADDLQAARLA